MPRLAVLSFAVAATLLVTVDARAEFAVRMPNGNNVPGTSALGHADGTGASDTLNAFGSAFENAGQKWTTALCQADSDGDGQTNGQELGDPCCEWTKGGTPKFSSGVSHPGDAASKVSAAVLATYSCGLAAANGTSASPPATTAPATSAASSLTALAGATAVATAAAAWTQW